MTDFSPCNRWCGEGCDPDVGRHSSSPIIATEGGPMGDPDTDRTVDVTSSVGISQFDGLMAEVSLQPLTWLRNSTGWGIPGELCNLLPELRMSATRARYLARLLGEAADEVDRINDSAGLAVEFVYRHTAR